MKRTQLLQIKNLFCILSQKRIMNIWTFSFKPNWTCVHNHCFAQPCLLVRNSSHVSDVAHGLLVFVLHITGYSTVGNSYYQQAAPTVTSNSTVANSYYQQTAPTVTSNSTVANSYYQQTAPTVTSNSTVTSDSSGANSQYVYQQTSYNPYQGNTLFVLCCMEVSFCVYCWQCFCLSRLLHTH